MVLIILGMLLLALLAGAAGYFQLVRLEHLSQARVANGLLTCFVILTLMAIAHASGIIAPRTAGYLTTALYSIIGGYFIGSGITLLLLRKKAGAIDYVYRSFWSDVAPALIAGILFIFGLYRTGIFEWHYFTGIGISSGLSLMGFAFWGWTARVVPEFRSKGILMLDSFIPWESVAAYRWDSEETLLVEYLNKTDQITEFKTYIPSEDELVMERIIGRRLKEFRDERKERMLASED